VSQTERVREVTRTARVVSGILCTTLGGGLALWACCWIAYVWPADRGWGAIVSFPVTSVATLAQFCVALLFAVTGVLYYRDSPRARPLLHVSSACLLVEIPLVLLAIYELATAK
jgi:hypothetical protein